jgi:hypothetical protein
MRPTPPAQSPNCASSARASQDDGRSQKLFDFGKLVLPSIRSTNKLLSDNVHHSALCRTGYTGGEMTSHGFQYPASTILNERRFNPDV